MRSYLKFDLSGVKGTITRATLVLAPRSSSRAGVAVLRAGNRWSERRVTFRNAPSPRRPARTSGRIRCCRTKVSLDVTHLVAGRRSVTLVLRSSARRGSSDTASFGNRERGRRLAPRLVVRASTAASEPTASAPSGSPPGGATAPGAPLPVPPVPTLPGPLPFPSWNGDLSTGNWSQYDSRPDNHPDGRPRTSRSSTARPRRALRMPGRSPSARAPIASSEAGTRALTTLWPNDSNPAAAKSRAYEGADSWYRDAFYLPASFCPAPGTDWNWLWEMHNYPDGPGDANL